jgi:hypothetical protein
MRAQNNIDFTAMDWSKVDREKAEFFYRESADYNDRLIESINGLNSKAFFLLAAALPAMLVFAGSLLSIWDKADKRPAAAVLLFAFFCLVAAVILLLLAVFPRGVYLSKGTPASYFTGDFYKADMRHLFSFGIASLDTYIQHNRNIEKYRGRLIFAAALALIAVPLVTLAAFFFIMLGAK